MKRQLYYYRSEGRASEFYAYCAYDYRTQIKVFLSIEKINFSFITMNGKLLKLFFVEVKLLLTY